jgi:fatty acid synthase subunit alpha, fungi type
MPFDGILSPVGLWSPRRRTRTSESVEQFIVQAAGVTDDKWEGAHKAETGGILTVSSELGEPIHKVATRGVKLWKEFKESVFRLPKDKRAAWLAQNADSVIAKLNKDFAEP